MTPFYWKPVRCLQRSIVTARLLRAYGIPAEVVIGYRAVPFLSHTWVEVAGRATNGSRGYAKRLQVLERL
jgi:transglutaminase-like putative cysteine protease